MQPVQHNLSQFSAQNWQTVKIWLVKQKILTSLLHKMLSYNKSLLHPASVEDYAFKQDEGSKILLGKWIKRYEGNCRYADQIDPKLITVMPKIRP